MKRLCKEWMTKQDKLKLYWDYNDYLTGNQVSEFLDYCEEQITRKNFQDPESYLYAWYTFDSGKDWFNSYEHDQFYDMYRKPFIEEHPELEDQEDEVDEILRNLMYELDMYDSNLKHFLNKEYHFYILTNPEETYALYDGCSPILELKHSYLKRLLKSQNRSSKSQSMKELLYSGGYNGLGICIMLNTNLFHIIDLMKAKNLVVRKGTKIYMFNPYIGTGGDTTELTSDWKFRLNIMDIGFGVDEGKRGPRGYTPDSVYGRVHSYFDCNKVDFTSLRK